MRKYRVAVVGCGMISEQYLACLTAHFPAALEVVACADLDVDVARRRAEAYHISRATSPDDVYAAEDIDIVLNLTNPWAHTAVNRAALESGKHVYAEKPLALNRDEARSVLDLAASRDLRVGCAPDTFLGAGLQTCRKVIDDGWIGVPLAAHAFIMMSHSSAAYNSERVGSAIMDMAPYYITALVSLFGPVLRVAGFAEWPLRSIRREDLKSPDYGNEFPVEAPMTVGGTLEFAGGVIASLAAIANGFSYLPQFEIYGTEGHLAANDPNMFGGNVTVRRRGAEPSTVPLTHQYSDRNRGLGLAEMAFAIDAARPHRASGELAMHVLDVMLSLKESSGDGRYREISTTIARPTALPAGHTNNPLQ